ncbi:hypothetical protein [Amphiplicatus metriothermophilus]|uniref:Fimbrial protein n=1 Tax=Amphiplicatus metriothermophilus TaxID=1519374 RepID=A0A239PZ14_9PROT|nr:hypothetical protein [Amphiplicatus metriothermophilus]MBB5518324.1 hypothetical protein [Amphiplicatus metriothermophilus]SNT75579.1 hypothetical protein SAMN06297382_2830 [Amphiplicatus metriothermophilus]
MPAENAPDSRREDAPPSGALPIASVIGARNLLIIIITMPLFFLGAFLAALFIFGPKEAREAARADAPARAAFPEPRQPIALPAGARVSAMTLDGDRLALSVETEAGASRVIIYDLAAGAVAAEIPLETADGRR